jgi:hypothetical protein
MQSTPVRYELWADEASGTLSFFPEDSESSRKFLEPGAKLIWSCTADSWEEAQSKKHQHLGWEPYETG